MRFIWKKEWKHLFLSMTGYVFLSIFLLASGLVFAAVHLLGLSGDVKDYFTVAFWIVLTVVPLLTMRTFSEERRAHTDDLLRTQPLSSWAVVLGKYLAVMAALALALSATGVYFAVMARYGAVDVAALSGNLLGLLLLASAFTAVGMFVSSRSDNQFVAAIVTLFLLLLCVLQEWLTPFLPTAALRAAARGVSMVDRYRTFTYGLFDPAAVVYDLGVTALFLALCRTRFLLRRSMAERVFSVLLAVLLVCGVSFADTLSARYNLTLDFSEAGLYRFDAETQRVLADLPDAVTVSVYNDRDAYPVVAATTLERLCALSPRLTLRYVNLYKSPVEAKTLADRGVSVKENDVLLTGTYRDRVLALEDLCVYDADGQITALRIEEQFVNALRAVARQTLPTALLTDSHGETPTQSLTNILEQAGYQVGYTTLESKPVCDLLVLAAPARDLDAAGLAMLDAYLRGGGRALVFAQPMSSRPEGLYDLYLRYGVRVGTGIVAEDSQYLSDNPLNVVPGYRTHAMTEVFAERRIFCVMPSSTTLGIQTATLTETTVQPVLMTSQNAHLKQDLHYTTLSRESGDTAGPFYLSVTAEQGDARLVFFGSTEMLGSAVLQNDAYADRTLLIRALNWLDAQVAAVSIAQKTLRPANLAVPVAEARAWMFWLAVVPSLATLLVGAAVTWKRRRA
ncbi:MAG: Gldg family protein [Candidatus Limiplasma sp.]|nr:Gldg family protein [Candidatus Limiplasma sp.]